MITFDVGDRNYVADWAMTRQLMARVDQIDDSVFALEQVGEYRQK